MNYQHSGLLYPSFQCLSVTNISRRLLLVINTGRSTTND